MSQCASRRCFNAPYGDGKLPGLIVLQRDCETRLSDGWPDEVSINGAKTGLVHLSESPPAVLSCPFVTRREDYQEDAIFNSFVTATLFFLQWIMSLTI